MNVFDQSIRCQPTYVAPCVLNNEQSSTKELRGEKKNHTAHKHTHTRRANEKQTNKFNAFIVEEKFSLAFVANAFLLPCHAMLWSQLNSFHTTLLVVRSDRIARALYLHLSPLLLLHPPYEFPFLLHISFNQTKSIP